jgi:prepilin-type N-terminal cleavage/methylation domain-containing protein
MTAKSRRSQAGFTLVELLVATAIGTLVMGALTSIILTTALSTNVATSRIDASNQVRSFQLTAYDDVALSAIPSPSGCGTEANPCTTQAIDLQGIRMPNVDTGVAAPYSVSYIWDPTTHTVSRQVGGGPDRTVATGVTSFAWYIDGGGAHPVIVVSLTVTIATYNASYSESQTLRFYPRVTAP